MRAIDHIRFHPNGRQIAFVGKREPVKREVWVLENFLSPQTMDPKQDSAK